MTRTRALLLLWLSMGVLVWSSIFDLWLSGASREYLLRAANWELARGPEPVMAEMMSEAARAGAIRASAWTLVIVGAGLLTLRMRK